MKTGLINPYHPLPEGELATIVVSHDKLQAWNDANEQALEAGGDQASLQVVKNIQNLAAAVIASEKPLSSQNFELRRALNLFDRTLNFSDLSEGAVAGAIHVLADNAEPGINNLITPGSMSLADAQARSQALRNLIPDKPEEVVAAAIILGNQINVAGQTVIKIAEKIWQQPGIVPAALEQAAQAKVSAFRQDLHLSARDLNPSFALGAVLGTATLGAAGSAVNPGNKAKTLERLGNLDWHTYEHSVGTGMHLPKYRSPRDFTDLMQVSARSDEGVLLRIDYNPTPLNHRIRFEAILLQSRDENFGHKPVAINFTVMAQGDRDQHGTGADMVHSAMEILRRNNIFAREFYATWIPNGILDSNHKAFIQAYDAGMTPEIAAKHTFSGKYIEKYGLTDVSGDLFKNIVKDNPHCCVLTPVFTRPDFGGGERFQSYGEAWVDAMGRPMRQLVPRVAPAPEGKPQVDIVGRLSAYLRENFNDDTAANVMDVVNGNLRQYFKDADVSR